MIWHHFRNSEMIQILVTFQKVWDFPQFKKNCKTDHILPLTFQWLPENFRKKANGSSHGLQDLHVDVAIESPSYFSYLISWHLPLTHSIPAKLAILLFYEYKQYISNTQDFCTGGFCCLELFIPHPPFLPSSNVSPSNKPSLTPI